jgi:hypothetical protein
MVPTLKFRTLSHRAAQRAASAAAEGCPLHAVVSRPSLAGCLGGILDPLTEFLVVDATVCVAIR